MNAKAIVIVLVGWFIILVVSAYGLASFAAEQKWQRFKRDHDCKLVAPGNWLCDDGNTYSK